MTGLFRVRLLQQTGDIQLTGCRDFIQSKGNYTYLLFICDDLGCFLIFVVRLLMSHVYRASVSTVPFIGLAPQRPTHGPVEHYRLMYEGNVTNELAYAPRAVHVSVHVSLNFQHSDTSVDPMQTP